MTSWCFGFNFIINGIVYTCSFSFTQDCYTCHKYMFAKLNNYSDTAMNFNFI